MGIVRSATLPLVGLTLLSVLSGCQPVEKTVESPAVVVVCRNGVAMSVWSAAYFNRLAEARGLRERAIARAAIASFTAVPLRMRFALAADGYRLDGYLPHVISAADAGRAERVVAIDADLPAEAIVEGVAVERWDGFPPMRERYLPSRAALKERVEALVGRLAASQPIR